MNNNEEETWGTEYTNGARENWEEAKRAADWRPDCLGDIHNCKLISVFCPWAERCTRETKLKKLGPANLEDEIDGRAAG